MQAANQQVQAFSIKGQVRGGGFPGTAVESLSAEHWRANAATPSGCSFHMLGSSALHFNSDSRFRAIPCVY